MRLGLRTRYARDKNDLKVKIGANGCQNESLRSYALYHAGIFIEEASNNN